MNEYGEISYCYNTGVIRSDSYSNSYSHTGGISSSVNYGGKIERCYNRGAVSGYKSSGVGLIAGFINYYKANDSTIINSFSIPYSSRAIIGLNYKGGGTITGNQIIATDTETSKNGMQLWTQEEITTNLTDKFVKDENNINNGYPVLKWQIEEEE